MWLPHQAPNGTEQVRTAVRRLAAHFQESTGTQTGTRTRATVSPSVPSPAEIPVDYRVGGDTKND